jgi:hypothetical protein
MVLFMGNDRLIFRRFSIHSVFSATPSLSITALFRELKAREDHPTLMGNDNATVLPSLGPFGVFMCRTNKLEQVVHITARRTFLILCRCWLMLLHRMKFATFSRRRTA